VYISGRPFVLRDSSEPRNTLHLSDRPDNLEAIEQRLKNDILAEGVRCGCLMGLVICAIFCPLLCRFGGLVLTHNEIGKELAVSIV
jgi:Inositol hexakisphosphate